MSAARVVRTTMRFTLICLSLAACGGDPSPAAGPDAARDVLGLEVAVDDAVAVVDVPPVDAPIDAAEEARVDVVAVVDVAPDSPAPVDAPRDVAAEADECGGGVLRRCVVEGVPMCVNITGGRPGAGGTIIHCGLCNNTCAAGDVCSERRCQRL